MRRSVSFCDADLRRPLTSAYAYACPSLDCEPHAMPALSKPIDAAPRRLLVIVRCNRLRGGGCGASTPARVKPELDEVSPVAKRPTNARYTEPAIVFELASTGDVRLLSFNWLAEIAESGQSLPRRQELPDAAFADMAALQAAHAALPPHVAKAVVPVVSISYCWLSAAEPDGAGEQLRHIVDVLQWHAEAQGETYDDDGNRIPAGWRDFFSDMAVFWDWGSIYQKDPRLFDPKETPEGQPEAERAAFIADLKAGRRAYGGAAYDASRSEAEYAAFKRGLHDTMDVWCAAQPCIRTPTRAHDLALSRLRSHTSQVRSPDDRHPPGHPAARVVHGARRCPQLRF